MGELLNYLLILLLAIRIALQAIMLLFVIDSYRHARQQHGIYATAVYAIVLIAWCFDALLFFDLVPHSDVTEFLQDGVLPMLVSISLLVLAVSSKKKKRI